MFHYDFTHSDDDNTQHWWTRKLVHEHVLAIEGDSDEYKALAFLKNQGFSEGCRTPSGINFSSPLYNPIINSDVRQTDRSLICNLNYSNGDEFTWQLQH